MTVDRQNGMLVFACDYCDEVQEFHESDFNHCWNLLKEDGWRCRKIKGEWVHGCEKCGAKL